MTHEPTPLPPPSISPQRQQQQPYVQISALEAGELTLPESLFVTDADPNKRATVPSLCFLIRHPGPIPPWLKLQNQNQNQNQNQKGDDVVSGGKKDNGPVTIVFDLGMKRDLTQFPEVQQRHIEQRHPVKLRPDVADSLREGGIEPESGVDFVVLSHVHWDHVGTPTDFPNSTFIVGPGTLNVLANGAPPYYPAELFNSDLLPPDRTLELPFPPSSTSLSQESTTLEETPLTYKPLPPFPSTIDLFRDSSLYLIHSPGHLPGHLNLLARISPTKWIYLGGDCCHDPRILTGEKGVAMYDDGCGTGGMRSVHADTEAAVETLGRIEKLREWNQGGRGGQEVEIIVAHDGRWREGNLERFWPGVL